MIYQGDNEDKCPYCILSKKHDKFVSDVMKKYGSEYKVIGVYQGCQQKILMKHIISECNREFNITPDGLLNGGHGCPVCTIKKRNQKLFVKNDDFLDRIKSIHGESVTVLSEYKGYSEKIKIRHEPCGREFYVRAGDLSQGKSCRYCAGNVTKTTEIFAKEMKDRYGEEYTVLGEYKDAKTKIRVRHNICGMEWDVIPDLILRKHRCFHCRSSSGENEIENFLIHNNIVFKKQYVFKDCKHQRPLRFDFAVLDDHDKVLCLIEYDGEFHSMAVKYNCTDKEATTRLSTSLHRDEIKNAYCDTNKYPLLRISYKDRDRINTILKEHLKTYIKSSLESPTSYNLIRYKKLHVAMVDLLNELPNGVYEKTFLMGKVGAPDKMCFANLMQNKSFQRFITESKDITTNTRYVDIHRPTNDWNKYFSIGELNSFNFNAFSCMKHLFDLSVNTNTKIEKWDVRLFWKFTSFNRLLQDLDIQITKVAFTM
jgi:hypothetical protein